MKRDGFSLVKQIQHALERGNRNAISADRIAELQQRVDRLRSLDQRYAAVRLSPFVVNTDAIESAA